MSFSIFTRFDTFYLQKRAIEGGETLKPAFCRYLFQGIFRMTLHEWNALLLDTQTVDVVIESCLLNVGEVFAQISAVGSNVGGQFLDG